MPAIARTRRVVVPFCLVAAISLTAFMAAPTSAAGAVEFQGVAYLNCYGCGTSTGTADLTINGATTSSGGIVGGSASAAYTTFGGTACVTGEATGSTTGAVTVSFNWTRVGAAAVITTSGDINGAGFVEFVVLWPGGIPCQTRVVAQIAGVLTGL